MNKVTSYVKNSRAELSKVIFPTQPQVKQAFIAVFIVVAFVSIFLAISDVTLQFLVFDAIPWVIDTFFGLFSSGGK